MFARFCACMSCCIFRAGGDEEDDEEEEEEERVRFRVEGSSDQRGRLQRESVYDTLGKFSMRGR